MEPENERYDTYMSRKNKEADAVAEKLPGIEQRNLHSAENNNY